MADLQQAGLQWLNEGLPQFLRGIEQANAGMVDVGKATQGVTDASRRASDQLHGADGRFVATGDAASGMGEKFSALQGIVIGVSTAIATAAVDAVASLGKALIGLGKDSIDVAKDFQSSMARLAIAANDPTMAMEDLEAAALAVGGDTRLLGVSASGAAEAMTGLYKAGLTTTEIFGDVNAYMEDGAELGGALRGAIDLAAATTLDMVQASDLAAVAMATFGSELETETERADFINFALNNMVKAADASVAEVEDLAEGIKNVGPQAAAMGFGIDEVNTALAMLSTRGIAGAEAGTNLNSMLTNLQRQTPAVTETLDELGVSLYDENGNFYSMVEIIGQFQVAMDGMTEAQRNQIALTVAGSYGQKAFNTLVSEGVGGWQDMTTAMDEASGIYAQAEAQSKTFAAQQEALDGVIETIKIRIGTALLPVLTDLAVAFQGFIEEHGDKLVAIFEGFGNVAQVVAQQLIGLIDGSTSVEDVLGMLPEPIQRIVEGFQNVAVWVQENWPAIQETISDVVGKIVGGFELVRAWAVENWPTIQAAIMTAWEVIGDVIGSVVAVIVDDVWPKLEGAFETLKGMDWDAIATGVKAFAAVVGAVLLALVGVVVGVVDGIAGALEGMVEWWSDAVDSVRDIIDAFAEKDLKKAFKAFGKLVVSGFTKPLEIVWKFVKGFVQGIYDFFKELSKKLVGKSVIPDMMKEIQEVIEDTLDAIADFVERVLNAIATTFERVLDAIADTVERVFGAIGDFIEDVMDAIADTVERVLDAISKFFDTTLDDIKDAVETVFGTIKTFIGTTMDSIQTGIETVLAAVRLAFETAWGAIKTFVETTIGEMKTTIETTLDAIKLKWDEIWDAVKLKVETVWGEIVATVQTKVGEIISYLEGMVETFKQKGADIVNGIRDGIVETWENVTAAIAAGVDKIGDAITEKIDAIKAFGGAIVQHIADGLSAAWGTAVGVIGIVKEKLGSFINDVGETAWGWIKTAGAYVVNRLVQGLKDVWNTADGIIAYVGVKFSSFVADIGDAWQGIVDAGDRIVDKIKEGINSAWQAFVAWLQGKIIGIFGQSEPTDASSPFRSAALARSGAWIGETIISSIMEGMSDAVPRFEAQLGGMIAGASLPSVAAAPVYGGAVTNTRITNVEVNATYGAYQSEAGIFYDVGAALAAAGA